MRKIGIAAGAVLVVSQVVWAASLELTGWDVTVTPDAQAQAAGEHAFKDTLIFSQGAMTSSACVKFGFGESAYAASETSGTISWATNQQSVKSGKTRWEGAIKGNAIHGSLAWQRLDGKVFQYAFEGTRKTVKSGKSSSKKRR